MNLAPLIRAFNHILAHPEEWDPIAWHCGTTHCLFGHCQLIAGLPESTATCFEDVIRLTGISYEDADWLSSPRRTLSEIRHYLTGGFDRDGFNRLGINRSGDRLQPIPLPEGATP